MRKRSTSNSPTLVADTNVWRHPPDERWFSWVRAAGHKLAIADQAARELLRQAATAQQDTEFEKVRTACLRVVEHAEVPLQPIECHLVQLLGLGVGVAGHPDTRRLCKIVALAETRSDFKARAHERHELGGGMHFVPTEARYEIRREQVLWRRGWRQTMRAVAPDALRARHKRGALLASAEEYTRYRRGLLCDSHGLARAEFSDLRRRFPDPGPVSWGDAELPVRPELALTTYCAVLAEALLDRFDGDHNKGATKVAFKGNDWYDVAQLRYVQADRVWVTGDAVWLELARRARQRGRVWHPDDVLRK